tara:strand:+ start:251 stop:493 length:243 start_codon:yes stop_codon:yes gene_type:complete
MRDYSVTKRSGEWYDAKVTDGYGVDSQNYYETEQECINWIYYMWETEKPPLTTKEHDRLLANAIHQCKEIDRERGLRAIL